MTLARAAKVHRVASDADFEQLHDLFVEYEADLPEYLRHGAVPSVDGLRTDYAHRNAAAFLATHAGNSIGCVAVTKHDDQTARVRHLFVRPADRGLGAGRMLVVAAIEFAREQQNRRIVLDTHKAELEPAYRLYRSLGFEDREPFSDVGYECPTFMELELDRTGR
jgi:ribosomal protein S18 acetylase RimI-like enzyme